MPPCEPAARSTPSEPWPAQQWPPKRSAALPRRRRRCRHPPCGRKSAAANVAWEAASTRGTDQSVSGLLAWGRGGRCPGGSSPPVAATTVPAVVAALPTAAAAVVWHQRARQVAHVAICRGTRRLLALPSTHATVARCLAAAEVLSSEHHRTRQRQLTATHQAIYAVAIAACARRILQ